MFLRYMNMKNGTPKMDVSKPMGISTEYSMRATSSTSSRNTAPTASEQEINAAISIVVAMYLYITGDSITDLEMSGYASEPTAPYNENEETAPLMAAEP